MIEVGALAASLVTQFLLPYLDRGLEGIADKVSDAVAESAGDQVVRVTKRIWHRVKALFAAHPEQELLFRKFEEHPKAMAEMIALELEKILSANTEEAAELEALVEEPVEGTKMTVANVIANSGVSVVVQDTKLGEGAIIAGIYQGSRSGRDDASPQG